MSFEELTAVLDDKWPKEVFTTIRYTNSEAECRKIDEDHAILVELKYPEDRETKEL